MDEWMNRVPMELRERLFEVVDLTDDFCNRHLNEEYAEMCRRLTVALARRRPSPLVRGLEEVWACGIVRTIGWANVLDDPKQSPYMKLIDIDPEFGVAASTGQGKSLAIRRMFGIGRLNVHWTLPSRLGSSRSTSLSNFSICSTDNETHSSAPTRRRPSSSSR